MKKVFISQPMNQKSEEEIQADRKKLMIMTKALFDEEIKIIDSYFPATGKKKNHFDCSAKELSLWRARTPLSSQKVGKIIAAVELSTAARLNME